jgi:hypothetical protein
MSTDNQNQLAGNPDLMPSLLRPLAQGPSYLKAGFLGFAGTGKTTTAALLAIAVKRKFGLPGPIAFFDTENGSDYIAPLIRALTKQEPVGVKTRDFNSLLAVGEECVGAGVSVFLADSMTHVWRSLCDGYLAGVNQSRRRLCEEKNWTFRPQDALQFQDWAPVKATWAKWTDFYLTSPMHVIICGRAGFDYDYEENERGKKELVKTGVKMKTESEFGFEPSLLVEMDVDQAPDGNGGFRQTRSALVRKDRFNLLDGATVAFGGEKDPEKMLGAVERFFGPHIEQLNPANHSPLNTTVTPSDVNPSGADEWARERDRRTVLSEEIQGLLTSHVPGLGADDKKKKADLIQKHFGTRSWTAIEKNTQSDKLKAGIETLKKELEG